MITYGSSDEKNFRKIKSLNQTSLEFSSLFSSQVSQAYAVARTAKKYNKNV